MISLSPKLTFGPQPPGGSDTQLQYNNSGVFGGSTGLTWIEATPSLKFANDTKLYFGSDNDDYYLEKRTGQTRLDLYHYNNNGLVYFNETALQIEKSLLQQGEYGMFLSLSASVSDSTQRQGFVLEVSGGTGSGTINGLAFDVTSSTTSATYTNDTALYGYRPNGIRGIFGGARGNISGIQSGGLFLAGGSNSEAYAVWGAATRTRTGGVNIGILGAAVNAAGLEFAGAFVFGSRASEPVTRASSAALLADNSTLDEDIFAALHNGSDVWVIDNVGQLVASEGIDMVFGTTTGTKIGTATTQKLSLWGVTPIVQPTTNAYTSDAESSAYTGIDNAQVGTVYATVADLNQLRTAYETLRASYDDLLTKLKTTGIVA